MLKSETDNVVDLVPVIDKSEIGKAADAILGELGSPSADELGEIIGCSPTEIQVALMDAVERSRMYRAFDWREMKRQKVKGIQPGFCANLACDDNRGDGCDLGDVEAVSCLFRMLDSPPNRLSYDCDIPSHKEALNMLSRAGMLSPGHYGRYNGTDFAHRKSTRKLWWSFVDLMVETGRIQRQFFKHDDGEETVDRGKESDLAKQCLSEGNSEEGR